MLHFLLVSLHFPLDCLEAVLGFVGIFVSEYQVELDSGIDHVKKLAVRLEFHLDGQGVVFAPEHPGLVLEVLFVSFHLGFADGYCLNPPPSWNKNTSAWVECHIKNLCLPQQRKSLYILLNRHMKKVDWGHSRLQLLTDARV